MAASPVFADRAVLEGWVERLRGAVAAQDRAAAEAVFEEAIPEFAHRAGGSALTATAAATADRAPVPIA